MDGTLPPFDLDRFLPYRLAVAAERLSAALASRYRSEFGISVAEWRVLAHLSQSGDISIRDIERKVSLEKSMVSRAASRLEAEGYITKGVNSGDRRLLRLALTPKGRTLLSRLIPLALAYQAQLEALIGPHLADLDAGIALLMREGSGE